MKKTLILILFGSFNILNSHAQLIAQDGKIYKTVKIGTQEWLAENLDVIAFRNGDPIPEAKTPEEWKKAATEEKPAWCYYNNDIDKGKIYGKLYNAFAVMDPRGLAPKGWHIPTENDWNALSDFLGDVDKKYAAAHGNKDRSPLDTNFSKTRVKAGPKMRSKTGWGDAWTDKNDITITSATNESGFNAIPSGYRSITSQSFLSLGTNAEWWSSTPTTYSIFGKRNKTRILDTYNVQLKESSSEIGSGLAVRCLKD